MKRIIIGLILSLLIFISGCEQFAVTGAETMYRGGCFQESFFVECDEQDKPKAGQPFSIAYIPDGVSGKWGVSIEDSVTGGCKFASGSTTFKDVHLSGGSYYLRVGMIAPSTPGTCEFTGSYMFGDKPKVDFPTNTIEILPANYGDATIIHFETNPTEANSGDQIFIQSIIKNIGDSVGLFDATVFDTDTGESVGYGGADYLNPGESKLILSIARTMPNKNWNLKVEIDRYEGTTQVLDETATFTTNLISIVCNTDADVNCNGIITTQEILDYALEWINGRVTRTDLGIAIQKWSES